MKNSSLDLKVLNFATEIDANVLLDKIQRFRSMNKKKLSITELRNEIGEVISFNNMSLIQTSGLDFRAGSLMFRIRPLENILIPNKDIKTVSDCWNPPMESVKKIGRLNKRHESLLYVCPDINTAIAETKVEEEHPFALIIYDVIDNIKGNCIGMNQNYNSLPIEHKFKMRLINDFLQEEFSRDVGGGTEYLYQSSELIAKDYFDLPPRDIQDAWVYPSIADKPAINLCFRPEIAVEKLSLRGVVMVSGYEREDEQIHFTVNAVALDNKEGVMEYFPFGSEQWYKVTQGVF